MPYGVAASPDGGIVLVSDQAGGSVAMINAKTLEIIARIRVGQYPEGIAFGATADEAYVANWFSDTVSVLDLVHKTESGQIKVGSGPRYLVALPVN